LHLIPFAAMYRVNGGARRYLIDDYEIEYAPSATLQNICRRRATGRDSQGGLAAIANPTSDLPFADFEADEICSHFTAADVESLRGQQARREAFTTARSTLHFAGHGRYDWNDPLGSHLLFAGGERLTLADLFDEAVQLPKTSLVILSACETSVTDPEDLADEYLGLASGFLFAGTPAVISTLWAVDDISTSLMMARFYQKHLCEGLRPGEALRAAQIWLRRKASHHLVEKHARATLARLKKQCAQTPQWSEEEAALNNQINRLELRIADLQTQNQFDSREKPFAHPHYWAAFTLSGASVEADPNEM
jgi:CHAT domain-containing protein